MLNSERGPLSHSLAIASGQPEQDVVRRRLLHEWLLLPVSPHKRSDFLLCPPAAASATPTPLEKGA